MKRLEEIIKESEPTLVVFQHAGNQDAVDTKYLVESLSHAFEGKARIVRIDASFDGNLKEHYKLEDFPTWILFKQGQELMRESGRKTEGDLSDMLQRAL